MKLINPSFEVWEQAPGLTGALKQIEKVGRVCYKSENKITENSYEKFVEDLMEKGHGAMLEHGTLYFDIPLGSPFYDEEYIDKTSIINKFEKSKYSRVVTYIKRFVHDDEPTVGIEHYAITTNYRAIWECGLDNDDINYILDKYLCEVPNDKHIKRMTVHFTCDCGVAREFLRHRVFSMAQESTRYCNYSKNKFDGQLVFIKPNNWTNLNEGYYELIFKENGHEIIHGDGYIRDVTEEGFDKESAFLYACLKDETIYMRLTEGFKCQAQEAREVLPLALKTEICMTGFMDDWDHFFSLRARGTTGKPHPQAKELAEPLMNMFYGAGTRPADTTDSPS